MVVKCKVSVPVFSLTITRTVLVDAHTHNRSDNAWLLKWGGGGGGGWGLL